LPPKSKPKTNESSKQDVATPIEGAKENESEKIPQKHPSSKKKGPVPAHVADAALRQRASIANVGFDFKKMGIGGLSSSLVPMFRRVFASRLAPPDVVKKMGVRHTKGVLLHGGPGTGKTLVARQIGKMLGSVRKPKLVSDPKWPS
jgi:vesicle-fusing ATPase